MGAYDGGGAAIRSYEALGGVMDEATNGLPPGAALVGWMMAFALLEIAALVIALVLEMIKCIV